MSNSKSSHFQFQNRALPTSHCFRWDFFFPFFPIASCSIVFPFFILIFSQYPENRRKSENEFHSTLLRFR